MDSSLDQVVGRVLNCRCRDCFWKVSRKLGADLGAQEEEGVVAAAEAGEAAGWEAPGWSLVGGLVWQGLEVEGGMSDHI